MKTVKIPGRRKPVRLATPDEIIPLVQKEIKRNKKFYKKLAGM